MINLVLYNPEDDEIFLLKDIQGGKAWVETGEIEGKLTFSSRVKNPFEYFLSYCQLLGPL